MRLLVTATPIRILACAFVTVFGIASASADTQKARSVTTVTASQLIDRLSRDFSLTSSDLEQLGLTAASEPVPSDREDLLGVVGTANIYLGLLGTDGAAAFASSSTGLAQVAVDTSTTVWADITLRSKWDNARPAANTLSAVLLATSSILAADGNKSGSITAGIAGALGVMVSQFLLP